MTSVKDIINYLEQIVPLDYQVHNDNSGLLLGNATASVTGVLTCLEVTRAVLQEARSKKCNLIIAHHPLIYSPLRQLIGKNEVEQCIIDAIKHDIAIYALHTNLDKMGQGVNQQIAHMLSLNYAAVLCPQSGTIRQLTTFVPRVATSSVLQALHAVGAGHIGDYTHCSFVTTGHGTFQPSIGARPHLGKVDKLESVTEDRVEVVFPTHLTTRVLQVLKETHPYQEVAYHLHDLHNSNPTIGMGMIGELSQDLSSQAFLAYLKSRMDLVCMRHTAPVARPIKRVAVCGGAGSFLIGEAIAQQADVFVTADVKYHEFFKAAEKIMLVDIGHYESEVGTKSLIRRLLSEKFANITVLVCKTVTNPIHYYY